MTVDQLAARIQKAKQLGKTRSAQEVAKLVKLPYDLVWGALMGGKYFTEALARLSLEDLK